MISGGEGYTFPIGDTSRYGELDLINNSASSPEYWQAQYYNNNPDVYGYDTSSRASDLEAVSGNEFWMIKGPGNQSHVKIRWDDESILPAETDDRSANLHIAEYLSGQWESVGDDVTDNGVNSGKVQTNTKVNLEEHVFTLATEESAPKPTAAFVTSDTSVCEGNSIELTVELTEGDSWTIEVDENGTTHTYNPSSSPFTFEVTSSANQTDHDGTYTITSVEDENGTSGNIYGDPVEVTVSSPPEPIIDGPNTVCQNTTEIYSVTPVSDDYYYDWLVTGGTIVAGEDTEQIQVEWQDVGTGSVDVAVGVDSTLNCESTDYIEVDVYETPEPNVTAPAQVCYPIAVDLDAGDTPEGSATFSYFWTSDSGIGSFDDPALKEPSYTPDSNPGQAFITVTFDVTIENDEKTGCNATGSVTTDIYRRPETGNTYYVPNDFDQ